MAEENNYNELDKPELIELVQEQNKEIFDLKEEVSDLNDTVENGANQTQDIEAEKEELENELEETKPQTILGELKQEILDKLIHLEIEKLQEIENEYCEGILGIERKEG